MSQNEDSYKLVDFTKPLHIAGHFTRIGKPLDESKWLSSGFVNDTAIAQSASNLLSPLLADFIDIALHVYLADRLILRKGRKSPQPHLQWSRRIKLLLPVRLPNLWNASEIKNPLEQLLRHFTEDKWQIIFSPYQGNGRIAEKQTLLFETRIPAQKRVALFSGGLDSFAGAAQQLADLPDNHFIFVSSVTNNRQYQQQREQIFELKKIAPDRITHVPVYFGLRNGNSFTQEQSQRTRGFMFLTLGVATAIMAGANELFVYENGIGAINLPYDETQIGTMCTRSVNPISLIKMASFVSQLIQSPFSIRNPFLFQTKAEMCAHPAVQSLSDKIPLTFSCDSFPIRKKGQAQCGICTSCLLRRQSLESAGLTTFDLTTKYLNDWHSCASKSAKLHPLFVMDWQVQKLASCLQSQRPWRNLISEFPELLEIASEIARFSGRASEAVSEDLLHLYSHYVHEWNDFSAHKFISQLAISE